MNPKAQKKMQNHCFFSIRNVLRSPKWLGPVSQRACWARWCLANPIHPCYPANSRPPEVESVFHQVGNMAEISLPNQGPKKRKHKYGEKLLWNPKQDDVGCSGGEKSHRNPWQKYYFHVSFAFKSSKYVKKLLNPFLNAVRHCFTTLSGLREIRKTEVHLILLKCND